MHRTKFRPLLLRCVVSAIACDGELHDDEVAELQRMVDDLPHFQGTDPDAEIPPIIETLRVEGFDALFDELSRASLEPRQRLQTLEAVLDIVGADGVLHPAEISFVRRAKEVLDVDDADFIVRFPQHVGVAFHARTGPLEVLDVSIRVKRISASDKTAS